MYPKGTKLVVVNVSEPNYPEAPMPEIGSVVISDGVTNTGGIYLQGYYHEIDGKRMPYKSKRFRLLEALTAKALLLSTFVEVTETSDYPIKVYEKQ